MFPRTALTVLLFLTSAAGQAPPAATPGAPTDVDQALRSRVDEFFRYHVQGGPALRKAMDMVAEDTKDEYFSSGKLKVLTYTVTGVEYNGDFTHSVVMLDVARNVTIQNQIVEMTLPMRTTWKLEDGKWMWYLAEEVRNRTPMSEGLSGKGATPDPKDAVPADVTTAESLAALAQGIIRPSSIDKPQVTLRWGQSSEDQVVFLNQFPGAALELSSENTVPGLTITLDKATVKAGENGIVRFRYAPPAGFDASRQDRPAPFFVHLTVVPFDQVFRIAVNFTTP